MLKTRLVAVGILVAGLMVGYFVYAGQYKYVAHVPVPQWISKFPFRLGLDLSGGTHLVYKADVSAIAKGDVTEAMNSLRDVIERRINLFGVGEPIVQVESPSFTNQGEERLIVDLPGVTDINQAVQMIGQTPLLEFRVPDPNYSPGSATFTAADLKKNGGKIPVQNADLDPAHQYMPTELTGRYLKHAQLVFDQNTQAPIVSLQFDDTGAKLFEKITSDNIGKTVAIFLDGAPISTPTVQDVIHGGQAQITGRFTPEEAKTLVGRLNSGALPVPVELISTQTIGATLGEQATHGGVQAALLGLLAIGLFLILWYRLPGVIAVLALSLYVAIMLALFKLFGITLTAGGIAGFIISIGLAVDANILIFERLKEEVRNGKTITEATKNGFSRAWPAIRDSNIAHMIAGTILFWFGTSLIKGFALVFILGVFVSMFSAITISRIFLYALNINTSNRVTGFLFGSGFSSARSKIN